METNSFALLFSTLTLAGAVVSACSGGSTGSPTAEAGAPSADASSPDAPDVPSALDDPRCEAEVQPSQTVSQRCCMSYGIDACGANLFCAAFDGRKVATCYIVGTRKGLESCTEDEHCGSKKCVAGQCQSSYDEPCKPEIGCVSKDHVCAKFDENEGEGTASFGFKCTSPYSTSPEGVEACHVCKNTENCWDRLTCSEGRCKAGANAELPSGTPKDIRRAELCCQSGKMTQMDSYTYICN